MPLSSVSAAFSVLAVELDSGPVFLAGRGGRLGLDRLTGALLGELTVTADGASATVEAEALPPECRSAWWANRDAAILEVSPDRGSVYDGRIVFDGRVQSEPGEAAGVLSLTLAPRAHRVVSLPDAGVIDTASYPLASAEAAGQYKPLVFGELDACPLLAVRLPEASALSATAYPGDRSLNVESTTGFDAVGAVWVGDVPIQYSSKTDSTLNGLAVTAELRAGTPVVKAGRSVFLAAAHPVALNAPQAQGRALDGSVQSAEGLTFEHRPLVTTDGSAMHYLAQFDQVASGANSVEAAIVYPAGETIRAAAGTLVTTQSTGAAVEAAADKTRRVALPYTISGWSRVEPAGYSGTKYPLWVVRLAASIAVNVPAGAEADVSLTHSDAADPALSVAGAWTATHEPARVDRVNGSVIDRAARVTSTGQITLTSDITLLLGLGNAAPAIGLTVINSALAVGRTLEQLLQGLNRAGVVVSKSALTTPAATVSWRQSASGTPLAQPAATSATTAARESASVATLGDLAVSILPPSSVVAGTYPFRIDVASQPRQDLTNPAPVYTATLGGVSFTVPKDGGTVEVSVPVNPGVPVNLVHTVCHAADLSAPLAVLFNGAPADLPDGAFPSAISLLVPQITAVRVTWSNAAIDKPALNAVNAIRAITGTVNQNAVGWETSIAERGQGNIVFPRPAADRIVSGDTTVAFTVNLNGYAGPVGVSIGGQNVYYADGGNPAYAWSPCTVETNDDADLVPVDVQGGAGVVVVTIVSASRTVLTGNIDGGKYATLRHPNATRFRAVQLDALPPRGRFKRARLFVEWFMGGLKGAAVPDVRVSFAGRHRGSLNLVAPAGSSVSKTVSVDSASAGAVSIPSLSVPQAVSGNVGALTHTAIPQSVTISAPLVPVSGDWGSVVQRGWARCPAFPGLVGNITARVNLVADNASAAASTYLAVTFRRANGTNISQLSNSAALTAIASNTWQASITLAEVPHSIFCERSITNLVSLSSVVFEWNATIASTTVSQTNNLSVGSQGPTGTGTAAGPAVSVTLGNNAINVTVPDAPRTTVTEFALAEISDWGQLTGQVCEIEYTNGVTTLDVHLVQVQIAIDYDDETRLAVGDAAAPVTAGVTGLSGNPADVLAYLAGATGQALEPAATRRLRDWCAAHDYRFARRLASPTDALTLLTYAAEQAGVLLARRGEAYAPVRWFDLSGTATRIREEDCLEAAQLGWAERVETAITLNYREDLVSGQGYTRTLVANAGNNLHCRQGLAALRHDCAVTLEAGWIRDDATAARYLADTARRYARPRRVLSLALPHVFSHLQEGELIRFTRLGDGPAEAICARITAVSDADGWPSITAEQIND